MRNNIGWRMRSSNRVAISLATPATESVPRPSLRSWWGMAWLKKIPVPQFPCSRITGPESASFRPKAKRCILIFLEGAPAKSIFMIRNQINELNGQPLPESMTKNVRFAFIKKESAVLLGSKRVFSKHGECGMEFSDLLPNIASALTIS